jgi:DNA-directed RNA polymerase subunit RPC12/RpoP
MPQDHKVHLYQKITTNRGKTRYKCMKSGCTHFVYSDLLPGRLCECYICGNPFELTKKLISQRTRFKCPDCRANIPIEKRIKLNKNADVETEKKIEEKKDIIQDVLSDLFEGLDVKP